MQQKRSFLLFEDVLALYRETRKYFVWSLSWEDVFKLLLLSLIPLLH